MAVRVFKTFAGERIEGDLMTRPLRGPLNDTAVDHSTDTYDTISGW
jgi:hypothetical protein